VANDHPVPNRHMQSQRGRWARDFVMVRWGKVLATRLEGGQYVCDVADAWGGLYRGVKHVSETSGAPGEITHRPYIAAGMGDAPENFPDNVNLSEVLLLFPDTPRPHPVIIGAYEHIVSRGLLTTAETDPARTSTATGKDLAAANDTDLHPKSNYRSAVEVLRGVRKISGYTGFLGLDTSARNKPVKVHVGEDMFVRLVHGLEATHGSGERVPLAYKLFAKMDEMLQLMENLRDAVLGIRSQQKAIFDSLSSTLPGLEAANAAWITAFVAANAAQWDYQQIDPYINFEHDDLAAAILRISSKTVSEGG